MAIYANPHSANRAMYTARELPEEFVLREVLDVTRDTFDAFADEWGLFALHEMPLARIGASPTADGEIDAEVRERAYLNVMRLGVLARHYLGYAEDDEKAMLAAWSRVDPPPTDAAKAWKMWEHHVNEALREFPLCVRVSEPEPSGIHDAEALMRRTTYGVAVLQLAQIATEGRRIHRCANETCGRRFTRQRSERRAYADTAHASGIKYCSRACAKAQSERERRRRRRDEKQAGGQGAP